MTPEPHFPESHAPPVRYSAVIVGSPEVFKCLPDLSLDILGHHKQRGDGRLEVRAALTVNQLEPLVRAGVTVTLEAIIESRLPQERIMPDAQAIAEAESVMRQALGKSDIYAPTKREDDNV